MPLEIRIMTGARMGKVVHCDKPLVTLGRQKDVDVQFDPQKDIDVSGRHAEIRFDGGTYVLRDLGSTNGTLVNGVRITEPRALTTGDRIQLGSNGPEVELRLHRGSRNTEERIAIAVQKQTRGLRNAMIAAGIVLVLGGGGAWLYSQRANSQRVEELNHLMRRNDSLSLMLQGLSAADPLLVEELRRKGSELRGALASATSDAERDSLGRALEVNDSRLRRIVQMNPSAIHTRNAPAVAVLVSEIRGIAFAGTGFGISPEGLLITNRHNVLSERGDTASRVAVKFVDTKEWLLAHVVKISDHPDDDLALIQIDVAGSYPVVEGISTGADAREGTSVVTIGFPLGYETPQEGAGNDFIAKSTLNAGTISKRTSAVLQIDSYAAHGSSGSPVFNSLGHVVGVVFGGHAEAGGRIVFAVPPDRVAAFIPADRRGIVR